MLKGEGKRFLHGDLICTYALPKYISDINIDGLCIIIVKHNFETGRDFVSHYLFTAKQRVMMSLVEKICKQTVLCCGEHGQSHQSVEILEKFSANEYTMLQNICLCHFK